MELYVYRSTGKPGSAENYQLGSMPDSSGLYQITADTALKVDASRIKPASARSRWTLDLQAIAQPGNIDELPYWKELLEQASIELREGLDPLLQERWADPKRVNLDSYWSRQGLDARTKLTNTKSIVIRFSQPVSWWDRGTHYEYYPDYPDLSKLNRG